MKKYQWLFKSVAILTTVTCIGVFEIANITVHAQDAQVQSGVDENGLENEDDSSVVEEVSSIGIQTLSAVPSGLYMNGANLDINDSTIAQYSMSGNYHLGTNDPNIPVSGTSSTINFAQQLGILYTIYGGNGPLGGAVGGDVNVTFAGGLLPGYLIGGGDNSDVNGNTVVSISGGQIGTNDTSVNGQGEVYGAGMGGSTVTGTTTVNISGGHILQHVVGGGSNNANVVGQTNVNITGGEINGHVVGAGGGSNNYVGGTNVYIGSGAVIQGTSNGGNVGGGGYSSTNVVNGNTKVTIEDGATISGMVAGGSVTTKLIKGGGAINGNSELTINGNPTIGGAIYAGSATVGAAAVVGNSTINLNANGSQFSGSNAILPGKTNHSTANLSGYQNEVAAPIGSSSAKFNTINIKGGSNLPVNGLDNQFFTEEFVVESGNTVIFNAPDEVTTNLTNNGTIKLSGEFDASSPFLKVPNYGGTGQFALGDLSVTGWDGKSALVIVEGSNIPNQSLSGVITNKNTGKQVNVKIEMKDGNIVVTPAKSPGGNNGGSTGGGQTVTPQKVTVWRAYNPNNGDHLFTTNKAEYDYLVSRGWNGEGAAFNASSNGKPVYRLYNPNSGEHFYTVNLAEYQNVANAGWNPEGIAFYSVEKGTPGSVTVYRLFNPNATGPGSHHFTKELQEYNSLMTSGWIGENVAFYSLG